MSPAPRQHRAPGADAAALSDALGALDRQLASTLSALQEMARALEPRAPGPLGVVTPGVDGRAAPAAWAVAHGPGPVAPVPASTDGTVPPGRGVARVARPVVPAAAVVRPVSDLLPVAPDPRPGVRESAPDPPSAGGASRSEARPSSADPRIASAEPGATTAVVPPEDAPPATLLPVDEVLGQLDRVGPPRTPRPVAPGAPADAAAPTATTDVPQIAPPSLIRPVTDVLPQPE